MIGYSALAAAVGETGLAMRGGFLCEPDDGLPLLPDGRTAQSLVLLGNVGANIWPAFQASPEAHDGQPDPLNRWSLRLIDALAGRFGALGLYPFGGPPHWPFQRWAQRAEAVWPSPVGMLIHPDHGLWHAYRGALAFAEPIDLPAHTDRPSPCDSCADKPCLTTCPVGAFTAAGYDVPACAGHIAAAAGRDCLEAGCLARRACPAGREGLYDAGQAGFHMAAFLKALQGAAQGNTRRDDAES